MVLACESKGGDIQRFEASKDGGNGPSLKEDKV